MSKRRTLGRIAYEAWYRYAACLSAATDRTPAVWDRVARAVERAVVRREVKEIGPIQFVLREDHEKVVKQLARLQRAVDEWAGQFIQNPVFWNPMAQRLYALRTKPGKRGGK